MSWRVTVQRPVTLVAPAKVNLGLEVLGRRPDGYHEVCTILQAVSILDRIVLRPAPRLHYLPPPDVGAGDLVARALTLLGEAGVRLEAAIRLEKTIPLAAGLGGGSSDAGTLLGALSQAGVPRSLVEDVAQALGSDVAFFLDGGTALASGRGTVLEPLPTPATWLVVVVPPLRVPNKTATLYARLTPADWSDGQATRRQAARLRQGQPLAPALLRQAFARVLSSQPACQHAQALLVAGGAAASWPSGAGPAWFTLADSWCAAWRLRWLLRQQGLVAFACHTLGPGLNRARVQATLRCFPL